MRHFNKVHMKRKAGNQKNKKQSHIYLNVCVWNSKIEIWDEELPSGFHTSSPASPSGAVEATVAVVVHVVLPFVRKLFGLQQMKENAPADFRIPLPLSITVHTAGCWGKQGIRIREGQGVQFPQEGPPSISLPTPSLQASVSVQTAHTWE